MDQTTATCAGRTSTHHTIAGNATAAGAASLALCAALLVTNSGLGSGCAAGPPDEPIEKATAAICSTLTLATDTPGPTTIGTSVTLTATAGCAPGETAQYSFLFKPPGAPGFTLLRPWGASNQATWTTTSRAPGIYTLRAEVRRQGQTTVERRTDVAYELQAAATPCSGTLDPLTDLAYAPTHARTVLDLYQPATGAACPVIVWIHGGGWQSGDKSLPSSSAASMRLTPFRARGFAIASINYRLSGDAIFPAQINDVKAAIRFLRANATQLRLDPQRIAAWGFSAGGHLAALAGTSAGVTALEDPGQGNAGFSSRVQAVVDCSGPIDLPAMDGQLIQNGCAPRHDAPASPESKLLGCTQGLQVSCPQAATVNPTTYVDTSDPSFLFGHGQADCNVPWQQSQGLAQALGAAGVSASVHLAPAGGHDLLQACPDDATVEAFLSNALR